MHVNLRSGEEAGGVHTIRRKGRSFRAPFSRGGGGSARPVAATFRKLQIGVMTRRTYETVRSEDGTTD